MPSCGTIRRYLTDRKRVSRLRMKAPEFNRQLLAPRHWPAWFGVFIIFLMARSPWWLQKQLGYFLGWLSWHLVGQRRSDTLVNLRLCFPEVDEAQRLVMARDVFRQAGISVFELANAWFRTPQSMQKRFFMVNPEYLADAHAQGRGVVLLGMHFSGLDLAGSLSSVRFPVNIVYRPQNNPVFEYVVARQRAPVCEGQIDHDNMRGLLKALKAGKIVWYTPDQDFGLYHGVMAPFFGVPAATITTPARLARANKSPVVMVHFRRNDDDRYELYFEQVPDFPTGDDLADATRINRELEKMIRRAPTQYMWFHRRFKTRADGTPPPYVKKKRELRAEKEAAAAAEKQP